MAFQLAHRQITTEDCRRYLRAYNSAYYSPARASNVEADERAYRLFDGGLARDLPTLTQQLLFIGKDFGGAKHLDCHPISVVIAERILAANDYHAMLEQQKSMEESPISPAIHALTEPFLSLPPSVGERRNFTVWASKVLHFARLDTFPILDSRARLALGYPERITLPDYIARHRPTFLSALDTLREASDTDPSSPTLLRRFDKILYQCGMAASERSD